MTASNITQTTRINWPIVSVGGLLGLMLSWNLLGGNEQGQVNVLSLLLIYIVVPVASLAISLASLIFGKGLNLARLAITIPLWPRQYLYFYHKLRLQKLDKHWLFLQSQAAALAFSSTSLLIFFLLLLGTDMNFIWRSTLLTAESLQPILEYVAIPWWFWPEAQPDLALLQATQDSRLQTVTGDVSVFSRWWPFVFATQLFYGLLLRGVLLVIARIWLVRQDRKDIEKQLGNSSEEHAGLRSTPMELAPITDQLPGDIMVTNWAGVDEDLLQHRVEFSFAGNRQLHAGPLASEAAQQEAERWPGEQLVIVKAWEPPMGDLADYMRKSRGYLLPLDWQDRRLCPPQQQHLEEWQRFVNRMPNWQLYQPASLRRTV
jgi:hypothetical protein